jgi:cardiolipin synthase
MNFHGHRLCETFASIADAPIRHGNVLELLCDGSTFLPAILQDIERASKSINVQLYTLRAGSLADRFIDALTAAASRGVVTNVLIDAVGSRLLPRRISDALHASGVRLHIFNPISLVRFAKINDRAHRKVIVVDGTVGYIGGMSIDDVFAGNEKSRCWRETMLRTTGPIVVDLQAAFLDTWESATRSALDRAQYFANRAAEGTADSQLILSSRRTPHARRLFLAALHHAQRSAYISNAYVIPDDDTILAITDAARRGVDVRILMPGETNNVAAARHASCAIYEELLAAGVRIFEYQPAMLHAKTIVVDSVWCSVGSTNLDARSLLYNDEANLNTCDLTFTAQMESAFLADLHDAAEITLMAWRGRPRFRRALELVARSIRQLL